MKIWYMKDKFRRHLNVKSEVISIHFDMYISIYAKFLKLFLT